MILASVAKLNMYIGDHVFDRVHEEFNTAQEEGLLSFEIDVHNMNDETRMDFMTAVSDLGYEIGYSANEEILEIWYE